MSDLISRQAAINALRKALYEYEDMTEKQFQESEDLDVGDWIVHRIFVHDMSAWDMQAITDLPSADRKGKWIKHSIGHEHIPWGFDCSECGGWFVVGEEIIKKYNYCPNCGARMVEEDEE